MQSNIIVKNTSADYRELHSMFAALVLSTMLYKAMDEGTLKRDRLQPEFRKIPGQVVNAAFGNGKGLVERLVRAIITTEGVTVVDTASGLMLIAPAFKIPIIAFTDRRVLGATVTLVENPSNQRLLSKSLAELRAVLAELASEPLPQFASVTEC